MSAHLQRPKTAGFHFLALACVLALSGCAGYQAFHEGQSELAKGNDEQGLVKLKQAVDADPSNIEYRQAYFTRRDALVAGLVRRAEAASQVGDFDAAREAYERASRMDPTNARAAAGSNRVAVAMSQAATLDAAAARASQGDVQGALSAVREVLSTNPDNARAAATLRQLSRQQADNAGRELGIYPKLRDAYRRPVSLTFSNATLQQAFDSLKAASGLNYVFDHDVRADARVTLSVTNKPVEDILRLLLATNQLEERVLDEDTLLIYPNTPGKAAEYREMIVRTFYLRHADAGKLAEMVRTITKARDVVVDEKLNLLVVRDSANVIRLAEKLIANQDVAEPEVVLDLEVLEVSTSRLQNLGVTWPSSVSASIAGAGGPGQLTWSEMKHPHTSMINLSFSDPALGAQLSSQVGDTHLLANPRIRVRNHQSAKTLIGERVPVFTTVTTANVGTSDSVNYLDVGLKLDIQPSISLDGDVSMVVALEVSNILDTVKSAAGTQAYRLGTRNTSTTLQVHDGETNVLAGLIQKEDQGSNTGLPWLNEIPLLSKLFGAAQDTNNRTEIVLLITPHIVRNIETPGVGLQEFTSGTEASLGAAPIQLGTPLQAAGGNGAAPRPGMPYYFSNGTGAPVLVAPRGAGAAGQPQPAASSPAPSSAAPAVPPAFTPPTLVPSTPRSQ
jgi:general secretion pathway protein D